MKRAVLFACVLLLRSAALFADAKDGRLDIYFVDVEGGAASVIVTPTGESMLIDSGTADVGNRDLGRVLDVIQNVAKASDHLTIMHWLRTGTRTISAIMRPLPPRSKSIISGIEASLTR